MAEINLGKIRIVYRGDWADSTEYRELDIVLYDGSSYLCKTDHTSEATTTPVLVPANWSVFAKGGSGGAGISDIEINEKGELIVTKG